MNFKRLLNTPMGRFIISIMLGLGLATLFRKVCTDKNCITFQGPIIADFEDKIYKYGDKCYKYTVNTEACNTKQKVLDIREPPTDEEKEQTKSKTMPVLLSGASPVASPPSMFSNVSSFFQKS